MTIRKALTFDREEVLDFCKDTFEWGDYIDKVWDNWLNDSSGLLLVDEDSLPNDSSKKIHAIVHLSQCPGNLLWIEGLRVSKKYRKKGIASSLLEHSINYGVLHKLKEASALVSIGNIPSQKMLEKLGFSKIFVCNYLRISIQSKKKLFNSPLFHFQDDFANKIYMKTPLAEDVCSISNYLTQRVSSDDQNRYFDSWKFYKLNTFSVLSLLVSKNRLLIFVDEHNAIMGIAVINQIINNKNSLDDKDLIQLCYLNCIDSKIYFQAIILLFKKYLDEDMFSNNMQLFLPDFIDLNKHIDKELINYKDKFIIYAKNLD